MAAKTVTRVFSLKLAQYKTKKDQVFVPPRLDDVIEKIFVAAPQVGDRHIPVPPAPPAKLQDGELCFCLNWRKSTPGKDGLLVECLVYHSGLAPTQTTPVYTAKTLATHVVPLKDATGNKSEVVHTYRVLFFGGCAIVEMEMGGGGMAMLASCLTKLIRIHVNNKHPGLDFADVIGVNLKKSMEAAGGVERITARLQVPTTKPLKKEPFSYRLSQLIKWGGANASVVAEIDFDAGDNIEKGLEVLEEFKAGASLDSVAVYLRDGQKVTGTGKLVEKRREEVTFIPPAGLDLNDVETVMRNYLTEVRMPDKSGWRLIDDYGFAQGAAPLKIDGKP